MLLYGLAKDKEARVSARCEGSVEQSIVARQCTRAAISLLYQNIDFDRDTGLKSTT